MVVYDKPVNESKETVKTLLAQPNLFKQGEKITNDVTIYFHGELAPINLIFSEKKWKAAVRNNPRFDLKKLPTV